MKRTALIIGIALLLFLGALALFTQWGPEDSPVHFFADEVVRQLGCTSNPTPLFTHHITDIAAVHDVQAPPRFVGEYLKTHAYIGTGNVRVPIYAPVDMTLSGGVLYADAGQPENYILDFDASCEIRVRYDHVTEPVHAIVNQFPTDPSSTSNTRPPEEPVAFSAGEIIGHTTRSEYGNWDFGVYDSTVSNRFADDGRFSHSSTYTAAVCPFDFFTPELRQEYVNLFIGSGGDDQVVLDSFCEI